MSVAESIEEYVGNGTGLDLDLMYSGMNTIATFFNTLLGILSVLLMLGLSITIAFEIAYIAFPTVRDTCDNIYNRLQGKPQRAFGLVMRDAKWAIMRSTEQGDQRHPMTIYLTRKIITVAVCIFIVLFVAGPGQLLVKYATTMIGNVLELLEDWFG